MIFSILNINQKKIVNELSKALGFGILSILLAQIKFYMPGNVGSISDLREIALIVSIFYFRHWIPIILVSFITAFATPAEYSAISTFVVHTFTLLAVYYIYKLLEQKILNRFLISIVWLIVATAYFYLFLVPIMLFFHYYIDLTFHGDIFSRYINTMTMIRFEMVATAAISALFLLNIKSSDLLKQQNADLKISKQKAEESSRLKTAFLQNLSHEIRTPMNGIIGFSQLLQITHDSKGQMLKYTELIVNSGNQLLHIVDDIVDASVIETDQIVLTLSKKQVAEFFNELKIVFELKNAAESHRIIAEINCDMEAVIKTDIYKLSRIIYHLIDNALKFSDKEPVILNCTITNSLIEFYIKDKGIGIAKKNWDEIFVGFSQLDNDLMREYNGSGLGLAIVKGFVTFLNGKIWLESELGEGTTFFVKIPLDAHDETS